MPYDRLKNGRRLCPQTPSLNHNRQCGDEIQRFWSSGGLKPGSSSPERVHGSIFGRSSRPFGKKEYVLAGTRPGISGGGKSFPGFPRNKIDGAGFAIGFEPARLGGGDEEAGLPV